MDGPKIDRTDFWYVPPGPRGLGPNLGRFTTFSIFLRFKIISYAIWRGPYKLHTHDQHDIGQRLIGQIFDMPPPSDVRTGEMTDPARGHFWYMAPGLRGPGLYLGRFHTLCIFLQIQNLSPPRPFDLEPSNFMHVIFRMCVKIFFDGFLIHGPWATWPWPKLRPFSHFVDFFKIKISYTVWPRTMQHRARSSGYESKICVPDFSCKISNSDGRDDGPRSGSFFLIRLS